MDWSGKVTVIEVHLDRPILVLGQIGTVERSQAGQLDLIECPVKSVCSVTTTEYPIRVHGPVGGLGVICHLQWVRLEEGRSVAHITPRGTRGGRRQDESAKADLDLTEDWSCAD